MWKRQAETFSPLLLTGGGGLCHGAKTLGDCFVVGIRLSLGFSLLDHSIPSCPVPPIHRELVHLVAVQFINYIYLITTSSLTECPSRVESSGVE